MSLPGDTDSPLAPRALGVAALLLAAGDALQSRLGAIAVHGELSGFSRASSGHCYFALKDADGANAVLRCAMFRRAASLLDFAPRDGQQVEVRGRIGIYEPRGELQCIAEAMLPLGAGSLYELFLRQKAKLEAAGLFDGARKRRVTLHPRAIGIVSSTAGAALHDVLTTLARRAPHVQVIVYPSAVQGSEAPAQLVQALQRAGRRAEVDTLILCRGGGSIEDLWAFNEEVLARAIAESKMPVVSGVGHETDFTIADFAADVRAPTPTGAAELVSPQRVLLLRDLDHRHATLARGFGRMMERRAQQLDWLARRLVSPAERLARQHTHLQQLSVRLASAGARPVRDARGRFALVQMRWQRWRPDLSLHRSQVNGLAERLERALLRQHERHIARVETLAARLEVLSPQRTLERGYAALLDAQNGRAVRAPSALKPGRRMTVHLAEGSADIALSDVQPRLTDGF